MSKPGGDPSSGLSSGDVLILPERHPACRRREARLGSGLERENLAGDVKGKGTSGSNREAESTDAPLRGGLPCSSVEAAVMAAERRGQGSRRADTHNTQTEAGWSARCSGGGRCRRGKRCSSALSNAPQAVEGVPLDRTHPQRFRPTAIRALHCRKKSVDLRFPAPRAGSVVLP